MRKYAQIFEGVVVAISNNPEEDFHPELAALFIEVPDQVELQWRFSDGAWQPPQQGNEAISSVKLSPRVSPIEFKLLFTLQERLAINKVRDTDPVLDDFFGLIEDPRLTFVDLGLQSTRDAIGYLAAQGLIGAERVEQILAGVMQ